MAAGIRIVIYDKRDQSHAELKNTGNMEWNQECASIATYVFASIVEEVCRFAFLKGLLACDFAEVP